MTTHLLVLTLSMRAATFSGICSMVSTHPRMDAAAMTRKTTPVVRAIFMKMAHMSLRVRFL